MQSDFHKGEVSLLSNEMSTNNMRSTWPTRPIFHLFVLGVCVWGNANFSVRVGGNANFSIFRYQHVGIPNAKLSCIAKWKAQSKWFHIAVDYRLEAYIPLQRKTLRIGVWCWVTPPTRELCIGNTNMLVSKNAKNLRHLTQNPNGHVNHVFCVDFICVWWPTQTQYPVEYRLKTSHKGFKEAMYSMAVFGNYCLDWV